MIRITGPSVLQLSSAGSSVKPDACLCGTVYIQVVQKLPVVTERKPWCLWSQSLLLTVTSWSKFKHAAYVSSQDDCPVSPLSAWWLVYCGCASPRATVGDHASVREHGAMRSSLILHYKTPWNRWKFTEEPAYGDTEMPISYTGAIPCCFCSLQFSYELRVNSSKFFRTCCFGTETTLHFTKLVSKISL